MLELFDDNRLSRILTILQRRNEVSLETLASATQNSARTVRNDIAELQKMLKGVAIIDGTQSGYRLYIMDGDRFEQILKKIKGSEGYFNSQKARAAYVVDQLMRSTAPLLSDDLAEDMNISRTTLATDLKKLKDIMKPYGVGIAGKTNAGLSLEGPEYGLRIFVLENMFSLIYGNESIDEGVEEEIRALSEEMGLGSDSERRLRQYITIMLDRYLTGNKLTELDPKFMDLTKSETFKMAVAIADRIEDELKITLPLRERIFITLPLAGMRLPRNFETTIGNQLPSHTLEVISKIRSRIKLETGIHIDMGEMDKEFAYHITFMINRLLYGVSLKNPISEEIRAKYPLAYKMAQIAAGVVSKEYDVNVPEDETGYLATYFGAYIVENGIRDKRVYSVGVISSSGWITAKLMMAQLKGIFDENTEFKIIAENKITAEELNKYDLIFSSIKIRLKTETPVIVTPEIFDEYKLLSLIERARYLHRLEIPLQMGHNSIIAGMIGEDCVFGINKRKSFLENTFDMIAVLEQRGLVDEGFKERIAYREAMNTMVFDKHIAFPHTVNKGSDKICLSIAVSEEPIVEHDREINLIFLLAVPENTEKEDMLLVRIYDELIAIANHPDAVKELASAKDYHSLIHAFIKISAIF